MTAQPLRTGPLVAAGIVLGTGMGGFVDGIVLHQILQWHNMLSGRVPPVTLAAMKYNMIWDGLFHALTWITTAVGLVLLWRAARRAARQEVPWRARILVGAMVAGWGLFNVVEGIIDHQILGIHHVHPGAGELAWDIGFLILGALQIGIGCLLVRGRTADVRRRRVMPGGAGAPLPVR